MNLNLLVKNLKCSNFSKVIKIYKRSKFVYHHGYIYELIPEDVWAQHKHEWQSRKVIITNHYFKYFGLRFSLKKELMIVCIYLSIYLSNLFKYLSIYLFSHPYINLSIYLTIHPPTFYIHIHFYPFIYSLMYHSLSIYLFIYPT